ncbi:MAG: carboxyl transferase domain-containing protein [SAR202 cluster bacterium]|jgi:acetyl/propionyl-CoA carboxylase alpha subunit/acetyl-CoA carboxylase carboxyltransferase component|nr:carboxyl transferase domain-containing protein [SAR202 cluster bacterium]
MSFRRILIANRGEIAIRVMRAATDLDISTVAVYSEDDAASLHRTMADSTSALQGNGVAAYLNIEGIIEAAKKSHCDAIHPGYGFLAENSAFARKCVENGIVFIGPDIGHLELFGDKGRAKSAAVAADVPILRGKDRPVTLEEAQEFFATLQSGSGMMIKAIAGGGGRGSRAVTDESQIENSYKRCRSEANNAFGSGDLYVEEFIDNARHIEVQILGDGNGSIAHLGERECSVQRRYQKILEIAPAPNLDGFIRDKIIDAALRLAKSVNYSNIGTFEFLVNTVAEDPEKAFFFIETNARLQVEHTVTESVTGVDIVQAQIRLAHGDSFEDIGLNVPGLSSPHGYAIQARINMETMTKDGIVRPSGGTLKSYETPNGPGVRTDGFGYAGYKTNPSFDSLLAKVITHSPGVKFDTVIQKSLRALSEFRIEGVNNNISFLTNVLRHPDFSDGTVHTRWVDQNVATLAGSDFSDSPKRWIESASLDSASSSERQASPLTGTAPVMVDASDPLALFDYDRQVKDAESKDGATRENPRNPVGPDGSVGILAPIQGTIVQISVVEGGEIRIGQEFLVMEAMKMEHVIKADIAGIVKKINVMPDDIVVEGHSLIFVLETDLGEADVDTKDSVDLDYIRPDLKEAYDRHAYTLDENRPEAVAKRYGRGFRMPRENIAQLVDEGSFKEYGPLVVARQHQRHTDEELRKNTPADGLISGIGSVNGKYFPPTQSRTMVLSYDYTVLAGTQGGRNHYKQDRMFELAERFKIPLVFFTEGGGGRPGDDRTGPKVAFDTHTFTQFSQLSGWVPLVGVTNGRCFAGNTALLACCDVIIATEGSTIAMGGPAMVESGGLGVYTPEELGPMSFQVPNGVVDILVKDEAEAVNTAKKYLSYFQGTIDEWEAPDQRKLRQIVPENRMRLYDMRQIIETIADKDSVLEIREKFGIGVITSFIRVEGKPMGVIANNPHHIAGAIDSDGADKGARFVQLCDAFDIPILSLMDCPGMMVGPDVESTALVRHCVRMFNAGANLTTPMFLTVVRKAYGLGVQAMCGASSFTGFFSVAWPTAEFAGMAIEGSVKLGYRKELEAIEDPEERLAEYQRRVDHAYENAKAVNASAGYGIDDVIDPADTRSWIVMGLNSVPETPERTTKKYPYIDTW